MELVESIQTAIDYIEDNLLCDIEHGEIAKKAFMSSFNFQRIFSMVCGITLGEYVRNRRLSLSKNDLLGGDIKIIDIALKYGYKSPEGYTRAFYRYYGVTPSAARKRKYRLDSFDKISVISLLKGESDSMNINNLTKRDYSVSGNNVIYYTKDMDKTAKWFDDILGWCAGVETRDDKGVPVYGSALPFPGELVHMNVADFSNGIMFLNGEPIKRTIAFINVKGIDKLYAFVKDNGWDEITEVTKQPWGGRTCAVTTIDDCVLTFSEADNN